MTKFVYFFHKKQGKIGRQRSKCIIIIGMIEIEMKAHVNEANKLIKQLKGFAKFQRCCYKDDTYWSAEHRQMQIRVREEKNLFTQNSDLQNLIWPTHIVKDGSFCIYDFFPTIKDSSERIMATYKKKQVVQGGMEVNQEYEFQVDCKDALAVFLQDAGFVPGLKKVKLTSAWTWENVTIELCYLPELGNFLELEILSEKKDEQVVAGFQQKLKQVLSRCGIEKSAIESRFYSELLQEVRVQR